MAQVLPASIVPAWDYSEEIRYLYYEDFSQLDPKKRREIIGRFRPGTILVPRELESKWDPKIVDEVLTDSSHNYQGFEFHLSILPPLINTGPDDNGRRYGTDFEIACQSLFDGNNPGTFFGIPKTYLKEYLGMIDGKERYIEVDESINLKILLPYIFCYPTSIPGALEPSFPRLIKIRISSGRVYNLIEFLVLKSDGKLDIFKIILKLLGIDSINTPLHQVLKLLIQGMGKQSIRFIPRMVKRLVDLNYVAENESYDEGKSSSLRDVLGGEHIETWSDLEEFHRMSPLVYSRILVYILGDYRIYPTSTGYFTESLLFLSDIIQKLTDIESGKLGVKGSNLLGIMNGIRPLAEIIKQYADPFQDITSSIGMVLPKEIVGNEILTLNYIYKNLGLYVYYLKRPEGFPQLSDLSKLDRKLPGLMQLYKGSTIGIQRGSVGYRAGIDPETRLEGGQIPLIWMMIDVVRRYERSEAVFKTNYWIKHDLNTSALLEKYAINLRVFLWHYSDQELIDYSQSVNVDHTMTYELGREGLVNKVTVTFYKNFLMTQVPQIIRDNPIYNGPFL